MAGVAMPAAQSRAAATAMHPIAIERSMTFGPRSFGSRGTSMQFPRLPVRTLMESNSVVNARPNGSDRKVGTSWFLSSRGSKAMSSTETVRQSLRFIAP